MRRPSVTFIMAARNSAETIRDSVESLLTQNYDGRVDIIVVDDASTDATASIVSEYPGITLLRNASQQGRSLSRNRALAAVDTELVAIQDADDVSNPNRLAETASLIAQHTRVVVGGQVCWTDPKTGRFQGGLWPTEDERTRGLLEHGRMPLAHPTMILPTALIQAVNGYDPRFPVAEDLDLLLRLKGQFPDTKILNSAATVTVYRRAKLDRLRYLTHAAYWRHQVMKAHHPACVRPPLLAWFFNSLRGYLKQRARLVRDAIVNDRQR